MSATAKCWRGVAGPCGPHVVWRADSSGLRRPFCGGRRALARWTRGDHDAAPQPARGGVCGRTRWHSVAARPETES
eukprot:4374244-Prymnesium_polylepis.1